MKATAYQPPENVGFCSSRMSYTLHLTRTDNDQGDVIPLCGAGASVKFEHDEPGARIEHVPEIENRLRVCSKCRKAVGS